MAGRLFLGGRHCFAFTPRCIAVHHELAVDTITVQAQPFPLQTLWRISVTFHSTCHVSHLCVWNMHVTKCEHTIAHQSEKSSDCWRTTAHLMVSKSGDAAFHPCFVQDFRDGGGLCWATPGNDMTHCMLKPTLTWTNTSFLANGNTSHSTPTHTHTPTTNTHICICSHVLPRKSFHVIMAALFR